jgi:D-citramalate synthase
VNVYLEDWSQGVRDSFDYVFGHLENLAGWARRVSPRHPQHLPAGRHPPLRRADDAHLARVHFEFHAHGDYGSATATVRRIAASARAACTPA